MARNPKAKAAAPVVAASPSPSLASVVALDAVATGPDGPVVIAAELALLRGEVLQEQPSSNSAPQVSDLASEEPEPALVPEGMTLVKGKSRDDRPFRRAGIVWTSNWEEHLVDADQLDLLWGDPHVLVHLAD